MVQAWMQTYSDPMFLWFGLMANAVSMVAFLAFAAPLTWLAWREPAWARPWRIQRKRPDVARWFWPGLRQWLLNNLILWAIVVLGWPVVHAISGIHLGPWPAWYVVVAQVVGFIYLDDALYYVMHRTMHRGWLYTRVHSMHHRVVTPSAVTGHYMHPLEFVLTAFLMLLGPLLLGVHVVTLYIWIVVRQLEAAEGHGGYHLWFSPAGWLPGSHAADFHDFHHAKFHGNYAGFLGWLDGALGTYSKGYAEHLRARRTSG